MKIFEEPMIYDYPEPIHNYTGLTCNLCDGTVKTDEKYYLFGKKLVCEQCLDDYIDEHSNINNS